MITQSQVFSGTARYVLPLALTLVVGPIHQAEAVLVAQDSVAGGVISWNTPAYWSPDQTPTAGNTYTTTAGLESSSATNLGSTYTGTLRENGTTFGGDSLTIIANTRLLLKSVTASPASTANIILNGGTILLSPDSGGAATLAGTINVASTSFLGLVQQSTTTFNVNSSITGTGQLRLAAHSPSPGGSLNLIFNGDLSGYSGTFAVGNSVASTTPLTLSFTGAYVLPNLTLTMGGVNNDVYALGTNSMTLNAFSLNGVSLAAGTYTAAQLQSYYSLGATRFTGTTGTLTVVPEPQAAALLCLGALGLVGFRRRIRRFSS